MDRANKSLSDWDEVVREESRQHSSLLGPILTGLATLVFGVGGFLAWAATTPVAQASMAAGRIIVQSNTKTVSHFEGGTLKAMIVAEGDKVKQGQLLATLDVTRSQSALAQLGQQLYTLQIRIARLTAEKDEKPSFTVDGNLPVGVDRASADMLIDTERKLFEERGSQFANQLAVDQSTIEQLDSQRVALEARRNSMRSQLDFLKRDYDALAKLQEKQFVTKTAVNAKEMQVVDMEGRIAENDASIAENKQRRTQAELSLSNRRTDHFRQISEQIQSSQADIARLGQQIIAAEDVVSKSDIRSPQDGIVANIKIRTPGSAVPDNQPILDIVPDNQPMLIEGRIRAADIDSVHIGERTEVKLTSFGAAETKPLIGHITYVAADGIVDERSGDISYVFRAKIDDGEMKKQPNLFLYPGMTADVYIVNGSRTALAYLTLPFVDSFAKAFREQ